MIQIFSKNVFSNFVADKFAVIFALYISDLLLSAELYSDLAVKHLYATWKSRPHYCQNIQGGEPPPRCLRIVLNLPSLFIGTAPNCKSCCDFWSRFKVQVSESSTSYYPLSRSYWKHNCRILRRHSWDVVNLVLCRGQETFKHSMALKVESHNTLGQIHVTPIVNHVWAQVPGRLGFAVAS